MINFQNPADNTGYMPLKRHIAFTVGCNVWGTEIRAREEKNEKE